MIKTKSKNIVNFIRKINSTNKEVNHYWFFPSLIGLWAPIAFHKWWQLAFSKCVFHSAVEHSMLSNTCDILFLSLICIPTWRWTLKLSDTWYSQQHGLSCGQTMLSDRIQTQKDKHCIFSLTNEIWKRQTHRNRMWLAGAVGKGKQKPCQRAQMSSYKIKNSEELMYITGSTVNNTGLCIWKLLLLLLLSHFSHVGLCVTP